ncbi:hypothetical protein [Aeoliella sp.]|uniref:hypothetical protein n=1 Tax=Aeoliella sp. TaxID=2795800 RepID=UPI003CCBE505
MSNEDREQLAVAVRTMQIIVFSMAMGCVVFAVILLTVIQPDPTEGPPTIAYIGVAAGLAALVAGVIVPRLIAASQPATAGAYQTTLIIGLAIFEGAAFLNLVAYMIEGQSFSLAVAAVLIAAIVMGMPTIGRVEDWLDARRRSDEEADAFNRR